jgi:trk system potassium uptake protein TrkH
MSSITKWNEIKRKSLVKQLFRSPARISIFSFAILISIGTALLMLPAASVSKSLEFVDALFTATSASCVTGLVIVDTGSALSAFGQFIILVLIQVGGLGIMTFSTLFLLMAGRRPSLTDRIVIQDTFTHWAERSLSSILKNLILFTFVMEVLGSAMLFLRFLPGRAVSDAVYLSIFHAVSAFCNAGFSLFAESLAGYRSDWMMNLVICILIISGGIGFMVISELRHLYPISRSRWSRLSLHTKMALCTTAILLISSTLLIIVMEWRNTLASFPIHSRILAAFFQAVTARTAGFNTLVIGDMASETLFIILILMFIGACPGSCGGGIKTTTFASLTLLGLARLRGRPRPQVFHRTIAEASTGKAISLVMVSVVVVMLGTIAILAAEIGGIPQYLSRGKFLDLLFEVVSAFGTVGLSTGVTGELSLAGKLIITLVMFIGRLGPLAVIVAISHRESASYYYAEENILIG